MYTMYANTSKNIASYNSSQFVHGMKSSTTQREVEWRAKGRVFYSGEAGGRFRNKEEE